MTCWAAGGGVRCRCRCKASGGRDWPGTTVLASAPVSLLSSYIFLSQIIGLGSVWVMPACGVSSVSPPPFALLGLPKHRGPLHAHSEDV